MRREVRRQQGGSAACSVARQRALGSGVPLRRERMLHFVPSHMLPNMDICTCRCLFSGERILAVATCAKDECEQLWERFTEETEDGALCLTLAHLCVQAGMHGGVSGSSPVGACEECLGLRCMPAGHRQRRPKSRAKVVRGFRRGLPPFAACVCAQRGFHPRPSLAGRPARGWAFLLLHSLAVAASTQSFGRGAPTRARIQASARLMWPTPGCAGALAAPPLSTSSWPAPP